MKKMKYFNALATIHAGLLLLGVSGLGCISNEPSVASADDEGSAGTSMTAPDPPATSGGSSQGVDTSGLATETEAGTDATSASTGGDPRATDSTTEPDDPEPPAPAGLLLYLTGDPEDADVDPTGPGLVLMGGGSDVDEAFTWWGDYIAGGDVVVLRTSGSDGYNDYLYGFGNADSVETMVLTGEFANDPYVIWRLRHAEAIWLAGGDQATYLAAWKDTEVEAAIEHAWGRGAIVGGTSAGLAVLGQFMFAAYNDTVYSYEALEDPYNQYMTMEQGFLALPLLDGIITDSHFGERDRMGRLIGFIGRIIADGWAPAATGLGVDEATALVVGPDGTGTVIGSGHAYVVHADGAPQVCMPGVALEYEGLEYIALWPGDTLMLPDAIVAGTGDPIAAAGGATIPADPYP